MDVTFFFSIFNYFSFTIQRKQRGLGNVKGGSLPFRMSLRLLEFGCPTLTPLGWLWLGLLEIFASKILA